MKISHRDEEEVQLLEKSKGKEKRVIASKLRKRGIFISNKTKCKNKKPAFLGEWTNVSDLVLCSSCKGFYSRRLFYRHKERCTGDHTSMQEALDIQTFQSEVDQMFKTEIISKFQNDDVGTICKTDTTIIIIGERIFQKNKKKVDRLMETRKNTMNDMRLLAKVYLAMKSNENSDLSGFKDLFVRKNFQILETAVETVTSKSPGSENIDDVKHGVKHKLYYLLRTSAQILKANDEDDQAREVDNFVDLLLLNQNIMFGDATYKINKNRQEKLRMPEQQAEETWVNKLRNYTIQTISACSSVFEIIDKHTFVKLRDALCSRITLFNARRGGEPSRLKLEQWIDAKSKRWVDKRRLQDLEDWEKQLIEKFLICYMAGKGNHLVPVLIPEDCTRGMEIMTDPAVRKDVGVSRDNKFIFANTEDSNFHVLGWDCTKRMCTQAGIPNPELFTATKQRHRVSTLYAQTEASERERQAFYSHMGHSKEVNEGTYQYPLPLMEITKVGRHLYNFDINGWEHFFID